jgi:hypothetical protein
MMGFEEDEVVPVVLGDAYLSLDLRTPPFVVGGCLEAAMLRSIDDPDYNPGLVFTLEESRDNLRAMVAPLYVGIVWLTRETCNYVDLSVDNGALGGRGEGTNAGPSGIKDGYEAKFDYNSLFYYHR